MEWGPAWVDSGRVFTRENGEQLRSGTVTGRFVQLAEEADLPPITLHGLRHGAASLMLAAGVDMKVVQETLGHSMISLTADTYTAVYPVVAAEGGEEGRRAGTPTDRCRSCGITPVSHKQSGSWRSRRNRR
jgi:integrase